MIIMVLFYWRERAYGRWILRKSPAYSGTRVDIHAGLKYNNMHKGQIRADYLEYRPPDTIDRKN